MFKRSYLVSDQSAALKECTEMMRCGSKSFFAASRVLPARVRAPATALYAFCRVADDAVDSATDPVAQAIALSELHSRLSAIYAGTPKNHVADKALAEVVKNFSIPHTMLEALLEGFAWDAQGKRYQTIDELHEYAARVAGTVGAMMTLIMGTHTENALSRACELGAAMQLTNIARDVGEDARNGRLYLPLEWMDDANIDVGAWLENPVFTPGLGRVISRLLDEADRMYWSAESGIKELPRDCRMAIHSASLVYGEIGRQLRRQGLDSVNSRAVVSGKRKLALIAQASKQVFDFSSLGFVSSPAPLIRPVTLPAVQFLVDAGKAVPTLTEETDTSSNGEFGALPSFYKRTLWVIDICERIAQEDRKTRVENMHRGYQDGIQA
jgi:15-cis-phytoene synthase